MKKLLLLAVLFLAFMAELQAEAKFNALDPSDPHYREYQRNLCAETVKMRNRFNADVFWLTAVETRLTPDSAEQYALAQALYERMSDEVQANCL